MNTLLPNLNAAPLVPTAPANAPNFQADPLPASDPSQPSQSQSFSQAMAKADADRTAAENANQAAQQNAQNAQNAQQAQQTQNAQQAQQAQQAQATQNAQNTQDAQSAQDTQSAQANQSSTAAPATAAGKSKDTDKTKTDKNTAAAGDADKASSDLLALVAASQATSKAHAQTTAAPALPVAAPVTAQVLPTAAKDADATKALTQALPDAWNAQSGKDKTAKTPVDIVKAAKDGADDTDAAAGDSADAKTTYKDIASGKADAANAAATPQLAAAAANTAPTAAFGAKAADLQALAATDGPNDNAALNPALQQVTGANNQVASGVAANKLAPTVGTTDWDQALGQKMVWMTGNGQQSATLTLNPRDLGPMQVVINVNKTQADATFIASNPEVKQALEAAMPRLREMMHQAGIQLGQANVSTGMPNQNQQAFNQPQSSNRGGNSGRSYGGNNGGNNAGGVDNTIASGVTAPASGSSGLGLVDTFV